MTAISKNRFFDLPTDLQSTILSNIVTRHEFRALACVSKAFRDLTLGKVEFWVKLCNRDIRRIVSPRYELSRVFNFNDRVWCEQARLELAECDCFCQYGFGELEPMDYIVSRADAIKVQQLKSDPVALVRHLRLNPPQEYDELVEGAILNDQVKPLEIFSDKYEFEIEKINHFLRNGGAKSFKIFLNNMAIKLNNQFVSVRDINDLLGKLCFAPSDNKLETLVVLFDFLNIRCDPVKNKKEIDVLVNSVKPEDHDRLRMRLVDPEGFAKLQAATKVAKLT